MKFLLTLPLAFTLSGTASAIVLENLALVEIDFLHSEELSGCTPDIFGKCIPITAYTYSITQVKNICADDFEIGDEFTVNYPIGSNKMLKPCIPMDKIGPVPKNCSNAYDFMHDDYTFIGTTPSSTIQNIWLGHLINFECQAE